jgi:hypothetical protein
VALAGRVLQPPLARPTRGPGGGLEHGRTIETGWDSTPNRPWPRSTATWTGRPVLRIRLRLFSHGVESVACRPSAKGAQSSSGRARPEASSAPTSRCSHATSPPWPATTRPSPGSAIATHAGLAPAQGALRLLDRSGMLRRRPGRTAAPSQPVPDRCESSRAPAALVHECSLTPSTVARLWAKELMAHLWTPVEPGLPPAHQLPKESKARAVLPASSSGPRVSATCWSRSSRVICGISTVTVVFTGSFQSW